MNKIEFKIIEKDEYTLLHFDLKDSITPEILLYLSPPKVNATKGVVLSGRGPIWLYCYLAHYYHPTKFIATYDNPITSKIFWFLQFFRVSER